MEDNVMKEKLAEEMSRYLKEYKEKISKLSEEDKKKHDIYLKQIADGILQGPQMNYSTVNKSWLKYYNQSAIELQNKNESIFMLLNDECKHRKNETALTFANFKIKYKEYIERIKDYAKSARKYNFNNGEIILVMLPNIPESREIIYANNIIGSASYCVTPMIAPETLSSIIVKNNIKKIVIFDQFYEKYKNIIDNCDFDNVIISDGLESLPSIIKGFIRSTKKEKTEYHSNVITLDQFREAGKNEKELIPIYEKNSTAVIIGTSGTTGTSKGVSLTNENLNAMALQHKHGNMNFKEGEKLLDILIQSIGYGISVAHYSGVCGLNSILIPELVTDIYPLLKKFKPQHFTGGPIHYNKLMDRSDSEIMKLKKFSKNMVSGGASLDRKVELRLNFIDGTGKNLNEENILVRQGIGCTENGGAATYAKYGSYKLGGVGIPLCMENMGIFKPGTDEELPYGCEGEICISGPTVMKEYLNNPEETSKVLKKHNDGTVWLHTCDLGYTDKDGQFYITDRIKNIFMRKGFNVHPSKINDLILSLDFVEDSIVYGIEHYEEQTVPVAFVKIRDNELNDPKLLITEICKEKLEEFSVPYDIILVDDLPRNLGGKVDKKALLKKYNIDYSKKYNK